MKETQQTKNSFAFKDIFITKIIEFIIVIFNNFDGIHKALSIQRNIAHRCHKCIILQFIAYHISFIMHLVKVFLMIKGN